MHPDDLESYLMALFFSLIASIQLSVFSHQQERIMEHPN
jgi:hypothetical protein